MRKWQYLNYFKHTPLADEWYWVSDPAKIAGMYAIKLSPITITREHIETIPEDIEPAFNEGVLPFIYSINLIPEDKLHDLSINAMPAWKERCFVDNDYNWREMLCRLAKFEYNGQEYWVRFTSIGDKIYSSRKLKPTKSAIYKEGSVFLSTLETSDRLVPHHLSRIHDYKTKTFLNAPKEVHKCTCIFFVEVRGIRREYITKKYCSVDSFNLKEKLREANISQYRNVQQVASCWYLTIWDFVYKHRKCIFSVACVIVAILMTIIYIMRNTNGADKAKGNVCSKTLEKESPQQLKPEKPAPQRDTSFCFGRNGKVQKDENGKKWFNGVPVPEEQPGDAFLHGKKISKPKIFKYRSERLIADLLQHPVGMPLPAAPNYAVDWDQDFANSLLDTIEINPNDSDEVKNIKRDVIETKKDLVQRIKNGEKFSDVIDETQREANKIASKRNEMLRIYNEIKRDGATPQELKDHLDAANKLLEREGALPLPISRKLLIQLDEKLTRTNYE